MRGLHRIILWYAVLMLLSVAEARLRPYPHAAAILLAAAIVVFAALGIATWRQERAIRRRIAALPLDEQLTAINTDPVVRDAAVGEIFGNERRDVVWGIARVTGPLLSIFYLPVVYSLAVPDERFDGRIVMALCVLGYATWRVWRRWYIRLYRCPGCRERLPAVSRRPLRFMCIRCGTIWRL